MSVLIGSPGSRDSAGLLWARNQRAAWRKDGEDHLVRRADGALTRLRDLLRLLRWCGGGSGSAVVVAAIAHRPLGDSPARAALTCTSTIQPLPVSPMPSATSAGQRMARNGPRSVCSAGRRCTRMSAIDGDAVDAPPRIVSAPRLDLTERARADDQIGRAGADGLEQPRARSARRRSRCLMKTTTSSGRGASAKKPADAAQPAARSRADLRTKRCAPCCTRQC